MEFQSSRTMSAYRPGSRMPMRPSNPVGRAALAVVETQGLVGIEGRPVEARLTVELRRQTHFLKHIVVVVDGGAVGAHRDVDMPPESMALTGAMPFLSLQV